METSTDEIKQNNIAAMGNKLGTVYSALWQEVARLFTDWSEFVSLFGTNPERIELLNSASAHFFGTIQESLWESILLKIARITDPALTGKKRNLSLHSLPNAIDDSELKASAKLSIKEALVKCEFARDWRNRRIAHADLALALDVTAEPLAVASKEKIIAALQAIQDVLNTISIPLLDSATDFGDMPVINSGEDLIYLLDFAIRKREEMNKRIESGNYTESDLAELRPRLI
jgi:hypothetical protein